MARTIGRRKVTITIPAGSVGGGTSGRTPIFPNNKFVTDFEIHFPLTNAGSAGYIGNDTVDSTWIPRTTGITYNFVHGDGTMDGYETVGSFNLNKIFLYTTTPGDTCIVEYSDYDQLRN